MNPEDAQVTTAIASSIGPDERQVPVYRSLARGPRRTADGRPEPAIGRFRMATQRPIADGQAPKDRYGMSTSR